MQRETLNRYFQQTKSQIHEFLNDPSSSNHLRFLVLMSPMLKCGFSVLLFAGISLLAQSIDSDEREPDPVREIRRDHNQLLYQPSYQECLRSLNPVVTRKAIYHDGWIDLNKNGKKDIYEDPTQPAGKRVDDLISQMTLEEKTCQLAMLYGYKRVIKDYLPTQK